MSKILIAVAAFALGLGLAPSSRAQDNKDRPDGQGSKDKLSDTTIRGIVAGVTVEGETVVDYKAKKAVEVDAAFLTVLGMPASGGDQAGKGGGRPDVYTVWLTPRTKICAASDPSGSDKKECSLDKLEVGDRVEIKAVPVDASAGSSATTPTTAMRSKHGRDRIYQVAAQEITILPAMRRGSGGQGSQDSKDR